MPPASPGTWTSPIIKRACLNRISTETATPSLLFLFLPPPPQLPSHTLKRTINTQLPMLQPSFNDAIHQGCANGSVSPDSPLLWSLWWLPLKYVKFWKKAVFHTTLHTAKCLNFMHKLSEDASHELLPCMKDKRWWDEAKCLWMDSLNRFNFSVQQCEEEKRELCCNWWGFPTKCKLLLALIVDWSFWDLF